MSQKISNLVDSFLVVGRQPQDHILSDNEPEITSMAESGNGWAEWG